MGKCARGAMKEVNGAELSSPARSPAHKGRGYSAGVMGMRAGRDGQLAGGLLTGPWEGPGGAAWVGVEGNGADCRGPCHSLPSSCS